MINFTVAPQRYKGTIYAGKHYSFKRADIWIDQHWAILKMAESLNPDYKATEDKLIENIVESIAHELMHILCKTNNEWFIMSIPKTQYSLYYKEIETVKTKQLRIEQDE